MKFVHVIQSPRTNVGESFVPDGKDNIAKTGLSLTSIGLGRDRGRVRMRMVNTQQFHLMVCCISFRAQVFEWIYFKSCMPVGSYIQRGNYPGNDPCTTLMTQQESAAFFGRAFNVGYKLAEPVVVNGYELRYGRFQVVKCSVCGLDPL